MNSPSLLRARLGLLLDGLSLLVLCGAIVLYFTTRTGTAAPPQPGPAALRDSAFAPLRVEDSAGNPRLLVPDPRARGLLLYVFKSDCPACGLQRPEWERIARLARARAVQVAALTVEPLSPSVRNYFGSAAIPAFRAIDPGAALAALQTALVPTTILVTDRGHIAFHAMGLLDPIRTRRLEEAL